MGTPGESSAASDAASEEAGAPAALRPYGPLATAGLGLLLGAIFVAAQFLAVAAFAAEGFALAPRLDAGAVAERAGSPGTRIAAATWAGAAALLAATALLCRLRGWSARDYCALGRFEPGRIGVWLLWLLAFAAGSDLLTFLLGRPIVPPFLGELYATSHSLPLLLGALVIAAPAAEEAVFRGFLHRGLAASAMGPAGAVFATAGLWAATHLQYDAYGIATVAAAGLLLGAARVRTGSLWPPLAMHAAMNAVASAQAVWLA